MQYHGVIQTSEDKWTAIVFKAGQGIELGTFDSAEEAARVWDLVMLASCGKNFAVLNFPDLQEVDSEYLALA